MKKRSLTIVVTLEVVYEDFLDDDYIKNEFLCSDRFSTLQLNGDPPAIVISAYSRIDSNQAL